MAARNEESPKKRVSRPATTLEGRESQLISLAYDLTERKLRDGTATSQEVTHFLKMGSTREQLEKLRMQHETELLAVKVEAVQANERSEIMFQEAINAMRQYSGQDPIDYGAGRDDD